MAYNLELQGEGHVERTNRLGPNRLGRPLTELTKVDSATQILAPMAALDRVSPLVWNYACDRLGDDFHAQIYHQWWRQGRAFEEETHEETK